MRRESLFLALSELGWLAMGILLLSAEGFFCFLLSFFFLLVVIGGGGPLVARVLFSPRAEAGDIIRRLLHM